VARPALASDVVPTVANPTFPIAAYAASNNTVGPTFSQPAADGGAQYASMDGG
jgi:hypothetical protein